jgi:hypothetical protein
MAGCVGDSIIDLLKSIPFHQILGQAGRLPHKKNWLRVGWAEKPVLAIFARGLMM